MFRRGHGESADTEALKSQPESVVETEAASEAELAEPPREPEPATPSAPRKETAPLEPLAPEPAVEAPSEAAGEPAPASFFNRLKNRLSKTKTSVVQKVRSAICLSGKVDDELLEEVEAILIQADVGPQTTERIVQRMKVLAKAQNPQTPQDAIEIFKEVIEEVICRRTRTFDIDRDTRPYVVLVTGVNGTGKTTTVGKMAKRCTRAGLKCMLIAADTFRAAAIEQLQIWADRSGSLLVRGKEGTDPASVCFEGLQQARQQGVDVVFIDTAGRLHTKINLMEELQKIRRVIQKVIPDAPHESLLVVDATTGQNAIQQTRMFTEAVQTTGIIMTKLDGTAKGGVLIAIRDLFDIPITLIGIGEGEDDLRDFEPRQFVEALFAE
jgi:fused signal recognition particle receptor